MSLNLLSIGKYIFILGADNFFVFEKNYTDSTTEELYSLLPGKYHPWCNFSNIWKNIYTVYFLDYHKAYCGSLKLNWETFAVSLQIGQI